MKLNKKDIVFICLIIFILIILFIVITFNDTLFTYMYNLNHYNYYFRTVYINDVLNDKEINYLYENASIMSINPQNRTYYNLSTDEYESIVIFPLSKNAVPDIVEGSSNLSNGGLICPVDFVPLSGVDEDFSITKDDIINGNDLIGTTFNQTFKNSIVNFETGEYNLIDTLEKTFTIVGTYDSDKYMMDHNICFISYEDFNEIYEFDMQCNVITDGVCDEIKEEDLYSSTFILVDSFDNISSVRATLWDMGYGSFILSGFDYGTIYTIKVVTITILIVFIIVIYIIISFNIKRKITKNEKEILLYKSMGYPNNKIIKIYYKEFMNMFLISTVIALIVSPILVLLIKYILSYRVLFSLIKIAFSWIEFVFVIVFGLVISSIIILLKLIRVIRKRRIVI